jgi:hypothetical protein
MLLVPFSADYDQKFSTDLGGTSYVFDARWNERAQQWNFDLTRESDQVQLLSGAPLLAGQDVLAPYALGIGGLLVTDLSNTGTDPGPDDLNDRVIVTYFTRDEMAILARAGVPGVANPGLIPPVPGVGGVATGTGVPVPGTGLGGGSPGTPTTIVLEGGTTNVNNYQFAGVPSFSDPRQFNDDTGVEQLAMQFVINAGANPAPTLTLALTLLALGNGTIRAYVGGSFGTLGDYGVPSGTLVGTGTVSGGGPTALAIGGTLTNPGGLTPVKITHQSTGALTDVGVSTVSGILS